MGLVEKTDQLLIQIPNQLRKTYGYHEVRRRRTHFVITRVFAHSRPWKRRLRKTCGYPVGGSRKRAVIQCVVGGRFAENFQGRSWTSLAGFLLSSDRALGVVRSEG